MIGFGMLIVAAFAGSSGKNCEALKEDYVKKCEEAKKLTSSDFEKGANVEAEMDAIYGEMNKILAKLIASDKDKEAVKCNEHIKKAREDSQCTGARKQLHDIDIQADKKLMKWQNPRQ